MHHIVTFEFLSASEVNKRNNNGIAIIINARYNHLTKLTGVLFTSAKRKRKFSKFKYCSNAIIKQKAIKENVRKNFIFQI